jgi:hypothetical protein
VKYWCYSCESYTCRFNLDRPCKDCKRPGCKGDTTCLDTVIKNLRADLLFNQEGWKRANKKLMALSATLCDLAHN